MRDDADTLRWCREVVSLVAAVGPQMSALSDDELRALTGVFRDRLSQGEPMDDLLPEAFAAVREAASRSIGQRPFDVQIMGGVVLHLGKIAEMRTGEGKTLTVTMPAYLHALSGAGVHVITANDYLASRDAEWMGPVYRALGLTVGLLEPSPRPETAGRRAQYDADVTYGPWSEFGYDYLRDNVAWDKGEFVQRGHHWVIVDEADLILIDEMRSPLLISAPAKAAEQGKLWQQTFARVAKRLQAGRHYESEPRDQTVSLTDSGAQKVEDELGIDNIYDDPNLPLVHYLLNALKAKELYQKDREYIVADGQAVIIDQTSGRLHHGRRFGEGIHEAIEAKEGLEIHPETEVLATVPMWDYLGRYQHLSGLTGTAHEEAETYRQIYQINVVAIPTNKPMIRVDHGDAIYRTKDSKLAALVTEISSRHATGQPVLVGATSVEEAQAVARMLNQRDIGHQVLSALNFEHEARVIAGAGGLGAVTVVAKMAGRGVDIILGGADGADREQVADVGGLCVLGAERPVKRRLEMHLRGRAGRQGDPGEAKFFVSFDDELVSAVFAKGGKQLAFVRRIWTEGQPFDRLATGLTSAQARQAANEAAWLVQMREWDRVVADQQHLVYAERLPAARGDDLSGQVRALIEELIRALVTAAAAEGIPAEQLWGRLRELYPVTLEPQSFAQSGARHRQQLARIAGLAVDDAQRVYSRREAELGVAITREVERRVILKSLDGGWRQHLQAMPDLANSIGIRASGPAALAEYRREGTAMFNRMRREVNREIVSTLFHLKIDVSQAEPEAPD
jgi:preprotein translocase subunit SecA